MIKNQNVLSIDIGAGVIGDEKGSKITKFINPDKVQEVYDRLLQNIELLKKKIVECNEQEIEQMHAIQAASHALRDVIRFAINPPPQQINMVQVEERRATLPSALVQQDENLNEQLRQRIMNDPDMTDAQKKQLLGDFDQNLQKLDAQLAGDRVQAETSLKKRLEERNRRRKELQEARKQARQEEERLRSKVNHEMKASETEFNEANKEYERERRKAREAVLGPQAKDAYR